MKIAIIGATGGTGMSFIEQATAQGHEVTALARTPAKLKAQADRIHVVQADARDTSSLQKALSQSFDAVVCIVGANGLLEARKVTDLYSATAQNLLTAMESCGLHRLISVSSSGVEPQANDHWFYVHVLKRFFLQPMYEDMLRMEALIKASAMNYTLVRPPYLTSGDTTGNYRISTEGNFTDDRSLRRSDLAHFLLKAVQAPEAYIRKTVALSE